MSTPLRDIVCRVLGQPVREIGEEMLYVCQQPGCHDQSGHLGVNLRKRAFNCILCGHGGKLARLLRGVPLPLPTKPPATSSPPVKPPSSIPGYRNLITAKGPVARAARLYLRGRRLDTMYVRARCGVSNETALGRLIFPVYEDGKLITYQARAMSPLQEPKTLSGKREDGWRGRAELLYGIDDIQQGDAVVVCEGIFDALSVNERSRHWQAVALLGSYISSRQVELLNRKRAGAVTVFLDGDMNVLAWKAGARLRRVLPGSTLVRVVVYLPQLRDEDPGSLRAGEINELISQARPVDLDTLVGQSPEAPGGTSREIGRGRPVPRRPLSLGQDPLALSGSGEGGQ
jgi:hypothetical protein